MNLVSFLTFFLHEMLSKCVDSGYLVGTTPLTVFHLPPIILKHCRCFLHEMKLCMWFWYNTLFFSLFLLCELSLSFFLHEMLSKIIDSGYLVGATPLTVLH